MQDILIRWNLPDLITRFRGKWKNFIDLHIVTCVFIARCLFMSSFEIEEQVNRLAFQYLNEDMIKELIPRVGRRAIFRHKYIEFKRKENKLVRILVLYL